MYNFIEGFRARHIIYVLFRGYLDQKAGKSMEVPLAKELYDEFDKIGITESNLDKKVEEYAIKLLEDNCIC